MSTHTMLPTSNPTVAFWTRPLTRREQIRLRFTWAYIRQTRLLNPLTHWWLNRGR